MIDVSNGVMYKTIAQRHYQQRKRLEKKVDKKLSPIQIISKFNYAATHFKKTKK